jgi:hypothetical protein
MGVFPIWCFAWNMKEESFMSGVNAISNWKWRVSYGVTGNRAIGPYKHWLHWGTKY